MLLIFLSLSPLVTPRLVLSEVEGLVLSEVEGLVLSEVEGLVLSEVEGLVLSPPVGGSKGGEVKEEREVSSGVSPQHSPVIAIRR